MLHLRLMSISSQPGTSVVNLAWKPSGHSLAGANDCCHVILQMAFDQHRQRCSFDIKHKLLLEAYFSCTCSCQVAECRAEHTSRLLLTAGPYLQLKLVRKATCAGVLQAYTRPCSVDCVLAGAAFYPACSQHTSRNQPNVADK